MSSVERSPVHRYEKSGGAKGGSSKAKEKRVSRSRSGSREEKKSSLEHKSHRRGSYSSRSPIAVNRDLSPRNVKSSKYYDNSPPARTARRDDYRRGGGKGYSRSPSPYSYGSRGGGGRNNFLDRSRGVESRCLGVFGLSLETDDRDLKSVFGRYGPIDEVTVVKDYNTGRSRGFAFIYFRYLEDAVAAKENAVGEEIDGRPIRIDYSMTQKPSAGPGNSNHGQGPASGYYEARFADRDARGSYGRPPVQYARDYSPPDTYQRSSRGGGGYRYEEEQLDKRDYARGSRREYGGRERSYSPVPARRRY